MGIDAAARRPAIARAAGLAQSVQPGRVVLLRLDDLGEPPVVLVGFVAELWCELELASSVPALTRGLADRWGPEKMLLGSVEQAVSMLRARGLVTLEAS